MKTRYTCIACKKPATALPPPGTCEACGGLVDVTYDLAKADLRSSRDSLVRWNDLLPIPEDSAERFPQITLAPTPTLHARSLGKTVGLTNLFIKNETVLPTGTTKDRIACVGLLVMAAQGVRKFAMTSTGNSSTSFARLLPHIPELEMCVFTPGSFLDRVSYVDGCDRITHWALRDGSYSDALEVVRRFEKKERLWSEGGFFNPSRREGLKLAFLEAVDQTETSFDWYVQAVSSAMGVYGCYKGATELLALKRIDRLPKLLCVQESSCAPMVHSFARGLPELAREDIVPHPNGVASAIMLGDPTRAYPHIARIVRESGGTMMAVTEEEIRDAQRALLEHEGIEPCLSASAAIGGVLKAARAGVIASETRVLVNVSGGERAARPAATATTSVRWLERIGDEWVPERS